MRAAVQDAGQAVWKGRVTLVAPMHVHALIRDNAACGRPVCSCRLEDQ